ncbi:hypothetical protein NP493_701g00021 [Ridgeia piscesae]|uniref:Uncharacterized protein n=1 Tax=Ridgeia piscesae TaxID=27915 RepID=A0AAD9NPH8_RIDPI|nr:hypothetical protein NP493_701g00021 [Ridgeia piscesae]
MLLAEVALLLSCLAFAAADVTHVKLERERNPPRTRAEWCSANGGSCLPREECLPATHVIASFCRHPVSVCCLPKKLLCENVYEGFCTTDLDGCRAKATHHVSELRCDVASNCCVPDEVLRRRQDHGGHWNSGFDWGRGCGGYGAPFHYPIRRGGYGSYGYGYGLDPSRGAYVRPGWPVGP